MSSESLSTAVHEALEVIHNIAFNKSTETALCIDNDWIGRVEAAEFPMSMGSVDNLFNEAIEYIQNDDTLSANARDFLPSIGSDNVAFDPVSVDWPDFDFSLFDSISDNNENDDDSNRTEQ